MQNYRIIYEDAAREDLDELPERQAAQIVKKIARLQHGLHGDIKRLQNHDFSYRLRMGDFRILFDVVRDDIVIQRIKDRKDAYN